MTEDETPTGTGSAADFVPPDPTLERMQLAVQECRGCGLCARATQAVFGKGTQRAEIMLVGEQPGDKEDLAGEPFVGPSGKLLDTPLAEAGIERSLAYVTNVVKHFKWKSAPSGKRRLHDKPNAYQTAACKPWLEHELAEVKPLIPVCLGATAAQAILGASFRVSRDRGRFFRSELGPLVTATVHPSAILCSDDRRLRCAPSSPICASPRRSLMSCAARADTPAPVGADEAGWYTRPLVGM